MEADNQTRTAADQLSRALTKIRADVRSNLSQVGWHPCAPTEHDRTARREPAQPCSSTGIGSVGHRPTAPTSQRAATLSLKAKTYKVF